VASSSSSSPHTKVRTDVPPSLINESAVLLRQSFHYIHSCASSSNLSKVSQKKVENSLCQHDLSFDRTSQLTSFATIKNFMTRLTLPWRWPRTYSTRCIIWKGKMINRIVVRNGFLSLIFFLFLSSFYSRLSLSLSLPFFFSFFLSLIYSRLFLSLIPVTMGNPLVTLVIAFLRVDSINW
jgi:hypothetical protein